MTPDNTPISLTKVLDESEHVKSVVEECAEDLSAVNATLTEELESKTQTPGMERALEQSEAVEDKVQDASERLAVVNEALRVEVRERHEIEDRLTALTEQSDADRHASLHDPLTGLPNRALFNDRLEQGLAQASRYGWTLAVLFLDLDNFKVINDVYGHEAGDAVLKVISERLKKITRRDDTISRHGGDEFLYLLTQIAETKNATLIAQKLIRTVQEPCELSVQRACVQVSVEASIGIAIFPTHGATVESLIRHADAAMYEAKRSKSGYFVAV